MEGRRVDTGEVDPGPPSRLHRFRPSVITGGAPFFPLFVLFGLNAVDELDAAAFNVLLPEVRDHFGLDNEGVLTLVALVAPVAILVGLPVAFLADRYRRTRIAATGGAVWSGFSAFTGLAFNVASLGVARAGSALGKAVNLPTHNSLLSDYYPVHARATVYGFHRGANSVGLILGPLLAGILAFLFSWRAPFLAFAGITVVFVVLGFGLQEPRRGYMDRLAQGADEETAAIEETPPRFGEAWRILHSIVTLRRLFFALPFLAATIIGVQSVISLFYEEVFEVGEVQRGIFIALDEPFAITGLVVGAPIAQRILDRDPGLALRFIAGIAVANGVALGLVALSPALPVAVVASWLSAFVRALLYPALLAVFSLVIPARARSLGFQAFAVWTLPGLVALPVVGAVSDSIGFRWAMAMLIPLYVIGGLVLSSAAPSVARDIENNRRWSVQEAEARRDRTRRAAAVARGEVAVSELPLLDVRDIEFSYGSLQVLFGVDIQVPAGGRVALLGTNGAGKSTVLKVVSGLLQPDVGTGGSVWFDGEDITYLAPDERVRRGITQIGGGRSTFPSLSVDENLRIGAYQFLGDHGVIEPRLARVFELFPVLQRRRTQPAGTLSGGEQQMMALGRALVAGPRLLIIDELSLGLAPVVMEDILAMVDEIVAQGTSVLVVEQSINVAAAITDHAYFMEKGEVRFSGPTEELLHRGDLARSVFFGAGAQQ